MLVMGLMSGTSADAIDAALVDWPDDEAARPFRLLAFREEPLGDELQARVHQLAAGRLPGDAVLRELASLDVTLGERFADAARAAAEQAGRKLGDVDAIASHGQTVAHHPELSATLQIGDPSRIAERTGCTVVADFRARDVAAGGEGAPLAPFFHQAVFADPAETRVVLNLGGIANVTLLPRGGRAEDVIAFDTGPANALADGVVSIFTEGSERFDRDGGRARAGTVDTSLLERLMDDDYLRRPPPKSTGRERYGLAEAEALAERWKREGREVADLVATLVAFTSRSVAAACRDFLPAGSPLERLLVGGGGAQNPVMMEGLRAEFPGVTVETLATTGVDPAAVEAMAFSLMGRNALLGIPNHLPRCTGAKRACVLGEIVRA